MTDAYIMWTLDGCGDHVAKLIYSTGGALAKRKTFNYAPSSLSKFLRIIDKELFKGAH